MSTLKEFDVFISHASEDKEAIARPLSNALKQLGFRVWFDEFELKLGDSLRRSIDKGLAGSNYGVVILSEPFFSRGWTNYEYDGLVQANLKQPGIILPIWHDLDLEDIQKHSLSLSSIVADKFPEIALDNIVHNISYKIGRPAIVRKRDRFEVDESAFYPVDSTDIEKGFVTVSTVQSDRILNPDETILGTEKTIMPIRDHYGRYEYVHWKSDVGDIDVIRAAVYDQYLNSLVDSEFQIVEKDERGIRANINFDMKKNRLFKIVIKITSKGYFSDLFNHSSTRSEFVFVSGISKFQYIVDFPPKDIGGFIEASVLEGPKGRTSVDENRFSYVASNVRSGTNLVFLLQNKHQQV